ncbi:hypothetical protein MYCTH_2054216, partial [Thermothelomyces thermophilus ATCC 42464]
KIELPGKYRGTKEDLVGFLTNLRSYFWLNNDKFPDKKAKVLYVATRLEASEGFWRQRQENLYIRKTRQSLTDQVSSLLYYILNNKALIQLFYNGLKEKVKDKLYKYDRPKTLDKYIVQAIRIDDRLYKQGQTNGTIVKANDKKKRTYANTSYETYPGAIDIDVITKDKSNVTYYNCGKKGHYKQECRSPKKE